MNHEQLRKENQVIQRRYENKYYSPVENAIAIPVTQTIRLVQTQGIGAGLFYLNGTLSNTELTDIIQKMALEVGLRFAGRTYVNLNNQKRAAKSYISLVANVATIDFIKAAGFGFNQAWTDWIKRFLFDFIYTKISFSVFETTKETLTATLQQAITEGWGIDETVKALEGLNLSETQAARVVRTEITRAANAGTQAASQTFPFRQSKEWLSAHDDRTRGTKPTDHASHVALDGNVVDYEGVFIDPRNGDELRFPGDPRASAESTINCRCSMAIVAKVGENGRLIPKRQSIVNA